MIWLLVPLSLISGLCGRLGGAGKHGNWYDWMLDTKWRDIGCSLILILATIVVFGWHPDAWWAYLLAFGLTWASFCTYWDKLFGYDCFWFSGIMVGVAGLPLMWCFDGWWWLAVVRIPFLSITWGLLNKYLPNYVFVWRRDVVEEFSRYTLSL